MTIAVHERGSGPPVLALHGAGSTHEEIEAFLAPALPHHRLLLPDLPGMGDSPADGVENAADAVDALDAVVRSELGDERFAIVGHSYGAHLARGLTARRPGQVTGLALICPMVPDEMNAEPPDAVADDGTTDTLPAKVRDDFRGYFVVRTAQTAERFLTAVAPSLGKFDGDALGRQIEHPDLVTEPEGGAYRGPVLIFVARHDSWVGWRQHLGLLDAYPHASAVVVADAGHALPHEQPDVLAAALHLWLARAESAEF